MRKEGERMGSKWKGREKREGMEGKRNHEIYNAIQ